MAERPDTPSVRGGHSLQSTFRIVIVLASLSLCVKRWWEAPYFVKIVQVKDTCVFRKVVVVQAFLAKTVLVENQRARILFKREAPTVRRRFY